MDGLLDLSIIGLILADFLLLAVTRLSSGIMLAAFQGAFLFVLAFSAHWNALTLRIAIIAFAGLFLKSFLFPFLLRRAVREAEIRREIEPFLGRGASLAAGILLLFASVYFGGRLNLHASLEHAFAIPAAFFTLFTGFLLIISRRTALMQSLGYIVAENGIYLFGMAAVGEVPSLVELSMFLDAFVAVFVMGIVIYHINREFDHIDTDRLNSLKG